MFNGLVFLSTDFHLFSCFATILQALLFFTACTWIVLQRYRDDDDVTHPVSIVAIAKPNLLTS